jgi:hypothetical protein
MSRVTYRLTKGKDPQRKKKGLGYQKSFPISYSLPAISRVRFQDPDTGEVTVRKIRYCPNETSIFMDEQPNDPKINVKKIRFENGFLSVDDVNDHLKYQFLELIDLNATKEGRDTSKPAKFERVDLAKKAKESLEEAGSLQETVQMFFSLNEVQQEAVAAMWGMKTHNKEPEVWKFALFQEVQKNPQTFKNLLESGDMESLAIIVEGQKTAVLEYHNHKWTFRGADLLKVPVGLNAAQELMKYLMMHPDTSLAISRASEEVRGKMKKKSAIEEEADQFSAEEMLEMGMKSGVLFYDKGRGWRFKEPYEPIEGNAVMGGKNSKPAAVKYLRENKDAKLEILFRRKVKIKEKAEQRRKEEAKRLSNK